MTYSGHASALLPDVTFSKTSLEVESSVAPRA